MARMVLILLLLFCPPVNAAIDFDGTDDSISTTISDGSELDPATADFTLSLWFKCDASDGEGNQAITGPSNFGSADTWHIYINDTSDSLIGRWTADGSGWCTMDTGVDVRDGLWHHFALSRVGTSGGSAYLDGTEYTGTYSGSGSNIQIQFNMAFGQAFASNHFEGQISEIAYWSTDLTDHQAALLYAPIKGLPLQIQTANLEMYCPLDDVADGVSADAATFEDFYGTTDFDWTGDDGGNNTGLTGSGERLSYQ